MKKLTPILTVDAIEPLLPFWTEGVGFAVTVSVPHPPDAEDGPLGFVILAHGEVELMLQTSASMELDFGAGGPEGYPDLVARLEGSLPLLFVEVEAIDAVLDRLSHPEVVIPRRTTFYGMDEIFLMAPGNALLGLAAKVE
jgi:hypothetical protein